MSAVAKVRAFIQANTHQHSDPVRCVHLPAHLYERISSEMNVHDDGIGWPPIVKILGAVMYLDDTITEPQVRELP